jgi:hypothetical protein
MVVNVPTRRRKEICAMSFRLARTGWLAAASLLALSTAACAVSSDEAEDDGLGASTDPVTVIDQSKVKRQSIGNCWIYATASWAESLAKSADPAKRDFNFSESYWTYFHWFDEIANGQIFGKPEVQTGGSYSVSSEIITRYGLMSEGDFIREEADVEMSGRQKSALDAINLSLKEGRLSTPEARRNRALVRSELDKAWGLSSSVVAQLDRVFGKSVTRTLDRSARTTGTRVKKATDIPVLVPDARTHEQKRVSLQDALGRRNGFFGRTGASAWQEAFYPSDSRGRREFQKRVQRAMHDHAPVIISWFVDFNALDADGRFAAPPATPGRQGGHMTVLDDYEIEKVPGFGKLEAGKDATPAQLDAALDDRAEIVFLRVKNSWGSFRPDRQFVVPGYHDLYMKYLNGPVDRCEEKEDGTTDTENCSPDTPLGDAVLPAGY